jgi:hypothetical protein
MIIFSLIETSFVRNNELFKRNLTKSKGNRIVKMGKLFLTNSLKYVDKIKHKDTKNIKRFKSILCVTLCLCVSNFRFGIFDCGVAAKSW